ncbi:MAG: hypothetical protein HYU86_00860 [Chloroflexi bacterium]|nr:hypothetical protein [Chloroflexota bacterium]
MRDIRRDIQERLEDVEAEKAQLQRRLSNLADNEAILRKLLEQEELRWKAQQPALAGLDVVPKAQGRSPLGRFILDTLGDGSEWTLEQLVTAAIAKGMFFNGKSPKRAIHFSLVGMKQNGLVRWVRSGVWKLESNEMKMNS